MMSMNKQTVVTAFSDKGAFMLNGAIQLWSKSPLDTRNSYPASTENKCLSWSFEKANCRIILYWREFKFSNLRINVSNIYLSCATKHSGPNLQNLWFQYDGAPSNNFINVQDYLNKAFPQQWIGRRGTVDWPPHSPVLSPFDYFFKVTSKIKSIKQNTKIW